PLGTVDDAQVFVPPAASRPLQQQRHWSEVVDHQIHVQVEGLLHHLGGYQDSAASGSPSALCTFFTEQVNDGRGDLRALPVREPRMQQVKVGGVLTERRKPLGKQIVDSLGFSNRGADDRCASSLLH